MKALDKKFAYDILTQRVMQFFLDRRGLTMEMRDNYALFHRGARLSPPQIEAMLRDAADFFALVPEYVKADRGMKEQPQRPETRMTPRPAAERPPSRPRASSPSGAPGATAACSSGRNGGIPRGGSCICSSNCRENREAL